RLQLYRTGRRRRLGARTAHEGLTFTLQVTDMSIRRALIALVVPAALSAQNDPTIDRIFRIGMDSSRVKPLAQVLFDSIGPRLTGSPGMTSASDWVISMYKSWGIDARREQYGTWRGWRRGY